MGDRSREMSVEHVNQAVNRLCWSCGFCCNGILFAHVPLCEADIALLSKNGVFPSPANGPLRLAGGHSKSWESRSIAGKSQTLGLPCQFLEDGHCTIYSIRPQSCRDYECKLLGQVVRGEVCVEPACGIIEQAKDLQCYLEERLEIKHSRVGFWTHIRNIADQSLNGWEDTTVPPRRFEQSTLLIMQELVAAIAMHFETTAV